MQILAEVAPQCSASFMDVYHEPDTDISQFIELGVSCRLETVDKGPITELTADHLLGARCVLLIDGPAAHGTRSSRWRLVNIL